MRNGGGTLILEGDKKEYEAMGHFYGVEVLALDILYERHFHYVLIADGADVCRDRQVRRV